MLVLGGSWAFLYMLELAVSDVEIMTGLYRLRSSVVLWTGSAWMVLALRLVNLSNRRILSGLLATATAGTVVILTNVNGLFSQELSVVSSLDVTRLAATPGDLFLIYLIYMYTVSVIGSVLLIWSAFRAVRKIKNQIILMLLIFILPVFLTLTPVARAANLDLVPITFSITALVLGVGLLRLRVFDLLPVAYDTIVANMPDGVMIVDIENRIMMMNSTMEALTDTATNTVYMQVVKRAFPGLKDLCKRYAGRLYLETELTWGDRHIELQVKPLYDRTKTLQGRLMVFRDVTDRRRIERQRSESETLYRALFRRSSDAILIVGHDDIIIDANPASSTLTGYKKERLIGKPMHAFQVGERDSSTDSGRVEFELRRADERVITIDLSFAPLMEGDESLFIAVLRDVTVQKQATQEMARNVAHLQLLRQVSEEIGDTLNVDHVLSISLDAALRLSAGKGGYIVLLGKSNHILATKTIGDYAQATNGRRRHYLEDDLLRHVLENREPVFIRQADDLPANAVQLADTSARIVAPLISHEQVVGFLNLETNNPDRFDDEIYELMQIIGTRIAVALENARLYRQAQTQIGELQKLYEQVSYLEGIKTDMIRIAAHDLRNPLSVLLGYLTVMELDIALFDAEYQNYIVQMLSATRRMNVMIDDILSLERIERIARNKDAGGEPFDLRIKVIEALQEFNFHAHEKKQALINAIPAGAVMVLGDSPQLYEAMTNLISNAIKYTPEGGEITVTLDTSEPDHVTYLVKDNGYGIPADQQDRLFQPFFRAKSEATRKVEGTGLGLHLVKNIIERHNGTMIFKSKQGIGSTFGFRLPVYMPETKPAEAESKTART